MMKKLFWILLLANAVLFVAMRWGGVLTGEAQPVALPLLNPGKIVLAGESAVPSVSAVAATDGASAGAHLAVVSAVAALPAGAAVPAGKAGSAARTCMEWGEFSGPELERATAALSGLALGDRLGRREVEYTIGYWVYLPPQKSKAGTAKKVAQLKARGVTEYFVVQEEGPWLNAISLGVFKTREAADKYVDELRARDVNSAQVGERGTKLKATIFRLTGLDTAAAAQLAALRKDFPESEQKEIACPR